MNIFKPKRKKTNVAINHVGDNFGHGSLSHENIENLKVKRDISEGKNLITVTINDKLIFSYDSNFKGEYTMENNIQKPKNLSINKRGQINGEI